jgi:phosphoserine phosphatase
MLDNDHEGEWSQKIKLLREEGGHVFDVIYGFTADGRLTQEQVGDVAEAFTEVFRRAGVGDHAGNETMDAMTYALYRDAIHQLRTAFVKRHPEHANEFHAKAPLGRIHY